MSECNHKWTGDTCSTCGVGWHVYAERKIKECFDLQQQLACAKETNLNNVLNADLQIGELKQQLADSQRRVKELEGALKGLISPTKETRTLPSGRTFTRHRCQQCQFYWDHNEPEEHFFNCGVPKAQAALKGE